ncbi:MAG: PAS domain-containing protein, partial [Cyanobacteria bacterium J06598_1]
MINVDPFFFLSTNFMCVLDSDGQFQAINPAFEQALGYSLAELQTRSLLAFVHPEDQMASQEAIQTLAAGGGTASFTYRCRCKALTAAGDKDTGDRWQWLTWSASAVSSPDAGPAQPSKQPSEQPSEQPSGQLLYCTAQNITARRTAEQAASNLKTVLQTQTQDHAQALSTERDRYTALLKAERAAHHRAELANSEAQVYADAVRNMSIGLYVWQLENPDDSRSLKMIATNPAATNFTGLSMESVLGKYIIEAFPALVDTDIPDIYAEVTRTKQSVDLGEIPYGDSQ